MTWKFSDVTAPRLFFTPGMKRMGTGQTSSISTSRHSSGKRLFECADLVLDNCGAVGDAAVSIEDFAERTGPTSTAVGAAILNAMVCAAVGEFKRRGVTPPVFVSANLEGGDAHNKTVMEQYKDQICYM